MKLKWLVLALLLFSATASAITRYPLDELSQQAHPVPAKIKSILMKSEADKLRDCKQQLGATDEQMADYFTASPIELDDKHTKAVLVLPSRYCYSFIGARAISFWIFRPGPGAPQLLLTGRRDVIDVLDESSNGLHDIATYYGVKAIRYQFDGKAYVSQNE